MTPSFRELLQQFNQHQIEYIVVGGVAAVLQGAPITTFDLDTLIKVDETNADRLLAAFEQLDASYREHRDLRPSKADILAGGHMLLLTSAGPLDVLGFVGDNERYEDLKPTALMVSVGELSIPVLSLPELIEQKRALGRPKDRAVLELLQQVADATRE